MNDNLSEFKNLIKNIQAMPHAPAPGDFTQKVMGRLNEASEKQGFWAMLKQALAKTASMSFNPKNIQHASDQAAGFYFLLSGLFFFFIGATLLNSMLYVPRLSGATWIIILQSALVLIAAVSLVAPGLMLAVNLPRAKSVARQAVTIFITLIIICAFLLNETVKTAGGGLVALAFAVIGVLMGIILIKSISNKQSASSVNNTLTGELHHV